MKFSMKKDSPFRNNIFPWLIYGFGTGFYISLLLVKMIKRPELLSPWITILLAAAGIALGAVYMMYLKKKVTNRRPYLSLKQGMIIVWVVGLLCILLTQISHWTYWLCIFLSGMSVGYFFIYIPKFIEIKNYLTDLMKDYETEKFNVSRQIVVQDIALLRAKNHEIISTHKGYILNDEETFKRVFKVKHTTEQIPDELNLIVDLGGVVDDVFVYHKVYGVIKVDMNIKSRRDVKKYIEGIESGVSTPLMQITSEYHYHTVSADSKETLDEIQKELDESGYLVALRDYEPVDFWSRVDE